MAGALGQNAQGAMTAAENETLNNCTAHECWQKVVDAWNSAKTTASNAFGQIAFRMPDTFVAAINAGADVPAIESATNLDLLKGIGNVAFNLPSFSLPGMPDYKQFFQYSNPMVGGIGEMYGLGGASELTAGWLGSNVANGGATTLYRAVSPEEYHSIMNTGKFSFGPAGSEMKQFGFNLNETLSYANFQPDYAAIIQADVPTALLGNFNVSKTIDPFIFRSGVLTVNRQTSLDLFNSVATKIRHAY